MEWATLLEPQVTSPQVHFASGSSRVKTLGSVEIHSQQLPSSKSLAMEAIILKQKCLFYISFCTYPIGRFRALSGSKAVADSAFKKRSPKSVEAYIRHLAR